MISNDDQEKCCVSLKKETDVTDMIYYSFCLNLLHNGICKDALFPPLLILFSVLFEKELPLGAKYLF